LLSLDVDQQDNGARVATAEKVDHLGVRVRAPLLYSSFKKALVEFGL
jgi:hypothetical protein